ncbi:hypothetical protein Tco_1512124, partial [Tanacetum coccineum]
LGNGLLGPRGGRGGTIKGRFGEHCGGNGGMGISTFGIGGMGGGGIGDGRVESIGGMGGGLFAIRSIVVKDVLGGEGLVVDGGSSPSMSSRDGEVGGVENKSSTGSRLMATGELIGEIGGEIMGEIGGALNE